MLPQRSKLCSRHSTSMNLLQCMIHLQVSGKVVHCPLPTLVPVQIWVRHLRDASAQETPLNLLLRLPGPGPGRASSCSSRAASMRCRIDHFLGHNLAEQSHARAMIRTALTSGISMDLHLRHVLHWRLRERAA